MSMWTPTLQRHVSYSHTVCTPLPPILYDVEPPGSEPPTSEDYAEFHELVEPYTDVEAGDYEFINVLFRELFTLDFEGHIIGVADNLTNPNIESTIRNHVRMLLEALQCVGLDDKGRAYPKLEPWIEATREALRTLRKQREECEDDPAYSRYAKAMDLLCGTYTKYQMAYPEVLVRAAIESNFDDSDPRKARLLRCTPHGRSPELTEMSKWYGREGLDYREEFTAESLAGMKPALLAYLEDLEDLTDVWLYKAEFYK